LPRASRQRLLRAQATNRARAGPTHVVEQVGSHARCRHRRHLRYWHCRRHRRSRRTTTWAASQLLVSTTTRHQLFAMIRTLDATAVRIDNGACCADASDGSDDGAPHRPPTAAQGRANDRACPSQLAGERERLELALLSLADDVTSSTTSLEMRRLASVDAHRRSRRACNRKSMQLQQCQNPAMSDMLRLDVQLSSTHLIARDAAKRDRRMLGGDVIPQADVCEKQLAALAEMNIDRRTHCVSAADARAAATAFGTTWNSRQKCNRADSEW
jgi:hypothetical protein